MKPQWYFLNFFLFFWNFLLHVRLERNRTIVLILFIYQRFNPYFGLKWSHNSILYVFEFFLQFFMNFLLRVGLERNGMIIFTFPVSRSIPMHYGLKWSHNYILNFWNFFTIFLEFFITRRVGTKRNDNLCFPSFSAFFNLFWL